MGAPTSTSMLLSAISAPSGMPYVPDTLDLLITLPSCTHVVYHNQYMAKRRRVHAMALHASVHAFSPDARGEEAHVAVERAVVLLCHLQDACDHGMMHRCSAAYNDFHSCDETDDDRMQSDLQFSLTVCKCLVLPFLHCKF